MVEVAAHMLSCCSNLSHVGDLIWHMVPELQRRTRHPWTQQEKEDLFQAIELYGVGDWRKLSEKIPGLARRNAEPMRLQWSKLVQSAKEACAASGFPWTDIEQDVVARVRNVVYPPQANA
jgi:hypothetical protein